MKKLNTRTIVMAGLLVALHIILSRFFSINAWNLKIGFAFVPVFAAAYLYGPLVAGLVGALGDFIGAILFPIGPYFPGFTLTCFLTGLTFGLLLHKQQTPLRIAGAVAVNQLLLGLLLNTYWITVGPTPKSMAHRAQGTKAKPILLLHRLMDRKRDRTTSMATRTPINVIIRVFSFFIFSFLLFCGVATFRRKLPTVAADAGTATRNAALRPMTTSHPSALDARLPTLSDCVGFANTAEFCRTSYFTPKGRAL